MITILRNFKIGIRILMGFAIVLVLLAIISATSYNSIKKLSNQTTALGKISSIKYHISQAIAAQNKYEITSNEDMAEQVNNYLNDALKFSREAQELIISANRNQIKNIELNIKNFQKSFNDFVERQSRKNDQVEIRTTSTNATIDNIKEAITIQGNLIKNSKNKAYYDTFILLQEANSSYLEAIHAADEYALSEDDTNKKTVISKKLNEAIIKMKQAKINITNPEMIASIDEAIAKIIKYEETLDLYKVLKNEQISIRAQTDKYADKVSSIAVETEEIVIEIVNNVKKSAIITLYIASVGAILLGLSITYLVTESITRPMKDYMKNIDRFSRGDLTVRFERSRSKDELSEMGKELNSMASHLRNIIEDILDSSKKLAIEVETLILESDETTELVLNSFNVVKSKSNHLNNILKGFRIQK